MSGELLIRPARAEDKPAVEQICANTWEWGDYIPEVWDQWLADPAAEFLVAEIDGRVVALTRVAFHTPEQAWLEGLRVDPEYRQRGIARLFTAYCLDLARERGAHVARLATGNWNTAIHTLMAEFGLERVGEGALFLAEPLPDGPLPEVLGPEHAAEAQGFLDRSPILAHMHGLYDYGWACEVLTPARLADLLSAGRVVAQRALSGEPAALAVAIIRPDDEQMWIGYADGQPEAVTALAYALRGRAARLGKKPAAMLPTAAWLHAAFRAAGYEQGDWQGELWVFEKWFDTNEQGTGGGQAGAD